MSRATANILLGVIIGGCALVLIDRVWRAAREEDADQIAERLSRRLMALESRVNAVGPAQGQIATS